MAAAKAAGAPTLNYGIFINTVIEFLIVAFVIFLIVKQVNRFMPPPPPPPPAELKDCPQCCTEIPLAGEALPGVHVDAVIPKRKAHELFN